ncbi:MAG: hypothetical protein K2P51_08535 [Rhabdochlamydiaceae bacterium]|nr:hypothetical protein [Rhabdochlamydiaceae bacterium]
MSVHSISHANGAAPVAVVPQSPEELSLFRRVSQFFFSWISLPSITDLLTGNWFTQERFYQMAYTGLMGAAGVGALGSLVLLIKGAPAVAALLGGLSLCSGAGAYMADQAAKLRVLNQCVDDIKKTNDDLKKTNENLRTQADKFSHENRKLKRHNRNLKGNIHQFSSENKHLKSNVQQISSENKKLHTNVERMTNENGKLNANVQKLSGEVEVMKQDHRRIRRKLERQMQQMQANLRTQSDQNGKYEAQNNRYRDLVNQCRECIAELRRTHAVQDGALLGRLNQLDGHMGVSVGLWNTILKDRQIFCDGYEEQLAALRNEIQKLQDPRLVQAQWDQQQHLQQQIDAMERRDKQLIGEIAQREGILQGLEQRLQELRTELAKLLDQQKAHNQLYAGNNKKLSRHVQNLSQQIAALDQLGAQYFGPMQMHAGAGAHLGGGQLVWT